MNQRYTDQEVIQALILHDGVVSHAAEHLGCARSTLYDRMEKVQGIKDVYEAINERQKKAMEDVGLQVALDKTHPQWFNAHRYYNRVKFGIHEQQVDVTSKGDKIEGFKVILPDADDS